MKYLPTLALLAAIPLHAGSIDLSAAESVTVRTGESLSFDLLTRSYAANAQPLGLPLNPATLHFALITAPTDSATQFSATLSSPDASTTVTLDSLLTFTSGYYSSAGYQGAVSTLDSLAQFDPQFSEDLFAAGFVRLRLTNVGEDVSLGLSPLLLSQDLYSSLSGGPLSVGAITRSVTLETRKSLASTRLLAVALAPQVGVPEPGTAGLLFAAGGALCALSALASRRARAGR